MKRLVLRFAQDERGNLESDLAPILLYLLIMTSLLVFGIGLFTNTDWGRQFLGVRELGGFHRVTESLDIAPRSQGASISIQKVEN